MVVDRTEIPLEDRWNVEALFPSLESWQEAFDSACPLSKPHWPEFEPFKGHLEDPLILKATLDFYFSLSRRLSGLYTYAHLRHDEDISNDAHKIAYSRINSLMLDFGEESAWIEPEILNGISKEKLDALIQDPILKDYRFYLEKIVRLKKHTLPIEKEELMAQVGKSLQVSYRAFNAINDCDFKFEEVLDAKQEKKELSHGLYGLYMRDYDRILRENAFKVYHRKYGEFENTLCELLNGQVQSHLFDARARKYGSCVEAALFPKNIDVGVYKALISAVNEEIGSLHKYIALRKKILNVDTLHLYDMAVPLTKEANIQIPYNKAEDLLIESVAPLGAEYQNLLRKGLKEQRWVDRYENKNKRSGAYSSGSYDTNPYILMNYKGLLKDVYTLAHEAGHSMHSLLTHMHQPYQYGHYPIFLAEVASTFNEELLMRLLLSQASSVEEKIYLINQKIEDIRGTLFRQSMFAEFELLIHEFAEKDIPLTPKTLKTEYRKLNEKYFGPDVVVDEESDIEWARVPHFYYDFYVYQYATGISAALALSERVIQGGETERNEYLSFLKGGCSRYPIEMLKCAGVDMLSPDPVRSAIKKFVSLVEELSLLTGA